MSRIKLEKQISFAPDCELVRTAPSERLSENNPEAEEPNSDNVAKNDNRSATKLPALPSAVESQLENTNYDVWSRQQPQPEQSSGITSRRKPGEKSVVRRFVREMPNVLLDNYGAKFGRPTTACSSACQHPWLPRTKLRTEEIQAQKLAGELSLLRTQIKIAQKHLNEVRRRRDQLLESNMAEQERMVKMEEGVHKDVSNLIVKYGKFRGAAESGQKLFEMQKQQLDKEVEETKIFVERELAKERIEVQKVEAKLAEAKKQHSILLTYKEDAFFRNNSEIEQLKNEMVTSAERHEKHTNDILQLMEEERGKMMREREEGERRMVADTAEDYMGDVHSSWTRMAEENGVIRFNIEKLKLECRLLEQETRSLKSDIKERVKKPTSNVRNVIYPQLFRAKTVCAPDDDVVLDIPTQKTNLVF
ncbi:uncharacterized protein C20orf96-like [Symsagittifera roscoffensis]|uniref:uncharacterized protein C20orf96-like n=1 Tax=Symsagittifera roscoffensis TaxID=84072 RepID=UPI00307B24E6